MAKKNKKNLRLMLDVISSVIKSKFIPAEQIKMVESSTHGKKGAMECVICNKEEETLLCSFDQKGNNKSLFPYFNETDGMVSMCDYILFAEDSGGLYVFSIDLKDTTISPKKQTIIGNSFAKFIINRICAIKEKSVFPKPVRFAQIGIKTTCEKQTTKSFEEMAYDSDYYMVLPDYHKFYTRKLIDLLPDES